MNKKVGRFQIVTNVQNPPPDRPAPQQTSKSLLSAPPVAADARKYAAVNDKVEQQGGGNIFRAFL